MLHVGIQTIYLNVSKIYTHSIKPKLNECELIYHPRYRPTLNKDLKDLRGTNNIKYLDSQ